MQSVEQGSGKKMYSAEISRSNPGVFLFLVDQSYSTKDRDSLTGKPLSEAIADAINKILSELIIKCSKDDVRDYFHVGVIAYGEEGAKNGFKGTLGQSILNPISRLAENPLRVEDRVKKVPDGVGGIIDEKAKFPVWFDPTANGGTPMRQAYAEAAKELVFWCENNRESFPPILINITDGDSTDGSPEPVVEHLAKLGTDDGNILIFNVHVSAEERHQILFPDSENQSPTENGKMLFRISSALTPDMQMMAKEYGFSVSPDSRGYCMNADMSTLVKFLEIGTRASNLR